MLDWETKENRLERRRCGGQNKKKEIKKEWRKCLWWVQENYWNIGIIGSIPLILFKITIKSREKYGNIDNWAQKLKNLWIYKLQLLTNKHRKKTFQWEPSGWILGNSDYWAVENGQKCWPIIASPTYTHGWYNFKT